jgi:cation diffusion facilitator family transporter
MALHSKTSSAKSTAAAVSVATNTALTAFKLAAALSSGSVSVLSEALHSLGDICASLLAYFSVRFSDKPADAKHPFGHGKVESFAGLAEALLLFAAGAWVAFEAVKKFSNPEALHVDLALGVIAATAIVNIFVGRYLTRVARETDSDALRADAAHITADFVTSAGVLAALVLVRVTGNPIFDPIVALGLTAWILFTAVRIAISAFELLIDARLPAQELQVIENVLREHPEVIDWHQLRTRKSGSFRHVDAHILLKDDLSLVRAHEITEEVEDQIRRSLNNVVISLHMEPYHREVEHRRTEHAHEPESVDK